MGDMEELGGGSNRANRTAAGDTVGHVTRVQVRVCVLQVCVCYRCVCACMCVYACVCVRVCLFLSVREGKGGVNISL